MDEQGTTIDVPLTRGYQAIVDACDAWVLEWKWCAAQVRSGAVYALRGVRTDGRFRSIYLHREVLGATKGQVVDHIDGDSLNCRRRNLRIVTWQQNALNRRGIDTATSSFKGVRLHKRCGWQASIGLDGRQYHLGYFPTEEAAARAYDAAARDLHGEFARLNFPQEVMA